MNQHNREPTLLPLLLQIRCLDEVIEMKTENEEKVIATIA